VVCQEFMSLTIRMKLIRIEEKEQKEKIMCIGSSDNSTLDIVKNKNIEGIKARIDSGVASDADKATYAEFVKTNKKE